MSMLKGRLLFRVGLSLSVMTLLGLAAMWLLVASGATGGELLVGGLVFFLAAVPLGWWLGQRLLRPVDEIRSVAERLFKGWGPMKPEDDEFGPLKQAVAYIESHSRERFQALEAERAKVSAILDSMTEGVIALDGNSRIVLMNPAARHLLACTHDPVEGRALLEVVRDRGLSDLVELCRSVDAMEPRKREIERHAPSPRMIEVNAVPVSCSTWASGLVLVLRDMTELRRLERVRAEFVANVSHELRTPLTAIKGYLETLLDEALPESATHRRFLEVANSHAGRMGRLIDDLRNLSALETGKVILAPSPIHIRDVANEVSAMFEKHAAKKGVELVNQVPSDVCVRADRDRLSQILVNLVDNAVKSTPKGGTVMFQAAKENDRDIRITVRDTGHGIPRTDLPRVTERFYRVDKARSREEGGTGLGLAIVKHLVQLHGGTLHIDSEYGKGTTIGVRLPAA